eukprot:scaffold15635_cov105-Isochrysis_galbana.AAC.3
MRRRARRPCRRRPAVARPARMTRRALEPPSCTARGIADTVGASAQAPRPSRRPESLSAPTPPGCCTVAGTAGSIARPAAGAERPPPPRPETAARTGVRQLARRLRAPASRCREPERRRPRRGGRFPRGEHRPGPARPEPPPPRWRRSTSVVRARARGGRAWVGSCGERRPLRVGAAGETGRTGRSRTRRPVGCARRLGRPQPAGR